MTISEIFRTMPYGPAPESATPAEAWLESHGRRFGHFIDGVWHAPEGGETFVSANPASGATLATIAQGNSSDVDRAVSAARAAQPGWAALGGSGRARFLYALARMVQRHSRLFAVIESLDNGKPIRESRDIDIPLVARHFYHHAGWAQLFETEFPGSEPIGVVGSIIPWNFPLLMLAWKIAPALAAGNTVVLKPAEFTPLTALLFAELAASAQLPAGVLNVVTGDGRTGEALVAHNGVDKIAFTGSTDVGRAIRVATAGSGKRLTLELGGKSPFLVFDDADLDAAAEGVVDAIWFNQGQVCCAGSRVLVQESVAPTFLAKLKARMSTLRMGDPLDKVVDIGAIVAPVQKERIERLVALGVAEGATLYRADTTPCPDGCFYPPTLLENVTPSSTVAQEEIFGPVAVSMTFRTPAEAVAIANNTRYGLAASVWSESLNQCLEIAPKLKTGTIWINSTNLFDAAAGFGGYRESGFGREGGREGLWEYVREVTGDRGEGTGDRLQVTGSEPAPSPDLQSRSDITRPKGRPGYPAPAEGHQTPRSRGGNAPAGGHPDARFNGSTDDGAPNTHGPTPNAQRPTPNPLPLDRTAKLYIGGKQARPDSGYSLPVVGADGAVVGEVGDGNRKDIRNAVEAARGAQGSWGGASGHNRAQILYYLAENLEPRGGEFAARIALMTGDPESARAEVDLSISRLFYWAAWADKNDGAAHRTAQRAVCLAMPEPIGVIGIACPDQAPLLALISLIAPAIAFGNTVIVTPSQAHPLAATDFYQVMETSDVPAGVVNIVTGRRKNTVPTLADHDDVEALWHFGPADERADAERRSAGNLKRVWSVDGHALDWRSASATSDAFHRHAVQIKNIWLPYSDELPW